MLDEGRYISQLLAYEEEIVSTLKDILSDVTHYKFLLIDGAESDLLPQHHPACTSKTGNLSDKFYQSVIDNHFFSFLPMHYIHWVCCVCLKGIVTLLKI